MRSRADHRNTGVHLRRLLAVAVIALAAGCSSVRMGYNNADTLLLYALDNYFDLSRPQEQLARDRLRNLLEWHRATQLHGYADLIEAVSRRIGGGVTPDDVLAFNLEMNRRLLHTGEQAAPDLAALALTLQPAQLERAARKLVEEDAKARREVSGNNASFEHRLERAVERAEEWFGSVSPPQQALIRAAIVRRPESEQWWANEREQRRTDLLKVLQRIQHEHPAPDVAAGWLCEYLAQLTEPLDPERRARMTEYRRGNAELIAALVDAASAEQKAVLLKKLQGYAEDFTVLATDTGTRSRPAPARNRAPRSHALEEVGEGAAHLQPLRSVLQHDGQPIVLAEHMTDRRGVDDRPAMDLPELRCVEFRE